MISKRHTMALLFMIESGSINFGVKFMNGVKGITLLLGHTVKMVMAPSLKKRTKRANLYTKQSPASLCVGCRETRKPAQK